MKNPIFIIFLTLAVGAVALYFIMSTAKGITSFGGVGTAATESGTNVTPTIDMKVSPTLEVQTGSSGFGGLNQ